MSNKQAEDNEAELRRELETLGARIADLESEEEWPRIEAVAMKSAAVSHDVNNLMSAILGATGLIRHELDEGHPVLGLIDSIEKAAIKAGNSTVELLDFTQGKRRTPEPTSLNPIVCHVLLVEEQQLAPKIRIVRNVDPDLWDVDGDYTQLTQLALNLSINAVESIEDTGRVIITTRNIEHSGEFSARGLDLEMGRYVYLSVEDTGSPMDSDTLDHIFDADFSTKSGNRGMGLATVHNIVKSHRGHIVAQSREDEGNLFEIYLPAYDSKVRQEKRLIEQLPMGTETILIVDDDSELRKVTKETLDHLGYTTLIASNGQKAIEVVKSYDAHIDLALLDLAMPVMGGAEAFPLLKMTRPEMPIIVCTGLRSGPDDEALERAGVSAFLYKPYRPTTLAQEVRKVLDGESERAV